jgi:hypothetical protein
MNLVEHLLVCLGEELNETGQEVAKCLRFTPHHRPDSYPLNNIDRVALEYADVHAVIELLAENGIVIDTTTEIFKQRVADKKWRTMNEGAVWARNLGALVD